MLEYPRHESVCRHTTIFVQPDSRGTSPAMTTERGSAALNHDGLETP